MSAMADKACSRCGERKPLEAFPVDRRVMRDGRASACSGCNNARNRRWYEANTVQRLAAIRNWERLNPEALKAQQRRHYYANRDARLAAAAEWSRANPEKERERHRRWDAANPDRVRVYNVKRRTAGPVSAEARIYMRLLLGDPCAYCGSASNQIDHIVPVAGGGLSEQSNLTAACQSCNRRKQAKSLLNFLVSR